MSRRRSASSPGAGSVSIGGDAQGPVSATHVDTQVLGVSSVPIAVAAKDPRAMFAAARVEEFTGRRWLMADLDEFMAASPCGYVLVEANAGVGKTALAAWLVKTRKYISHFSRYSGGRRTRTALQNLSAQLVRETGLTEQAPGGMLPDWVQTPSGFESLLGMAAAAAARRGQRLVLVVDGLDEADPPDDGLPYGLPGLLPDGVFVIGTYRTGYPLKWPDCPTLSLRIGKDSPENYADINAYLLQTTFEKELAEGLAESGIGAAEFADVLSARCQGAWVYLRYVLDELRSGVRRVDSINELPLGLWAYYAGEVRRWRGEPAWDSEMLPLLATLGVAGEALTAAAIARLAGGISEAVVRRRCELVLRPLLTSPSVDGARRYEIYHSSFRTVLAGLQDPRQGEFPAVVPDDLLALADELRRASIAAHSRFADVYLTSFGGLDAGLPALAERLDLAQADSGYPLRHLVRHLHHASRFPDLHRMLHTEHQATTGGTVNTWFAAHDHAGSLGLYVDDLARARDIAATAAQADLASRQPTRALGLSIRYTLMGASLASRTEQIRIEILEQLLAAGVWSTARGLDHARRLADPEHRLEALLAIHRCTASGKVPQGNAVAADAPSSEALDEALATASALTKCHRRARALTDVAVHLPAVRQQAVITQALAAALEEDADTFRSWGIAAVAPHLPPDLLGQALEAAEAMTEDSARAAALTELAPHLPTSKKRAALADALDAASSCSDHTRARVLMMLAPHQPGEVLAAVSTLTESQAQQWVLKALAPHLPADLLSQAWATAAAADGVERDDVLTALAPYLPADLQLEYLATASAITSVGRRTEILTALIPHLPAAQQLEVLTEALAAAAADAGYGDGPSAAALAALAPLLTPDLLSKALAAAANIKPALSRAAALTALAERAPARQRSEVLAEAAQAAALAIKAVRLYPETLMDVASRLPVVPRAEILRSALIVATEISDYTYQAQALTALGALLPLQERSDILAEALAAATACQYEHDKAEALMALAPHIPDMVLAVTSSVAEGQPCEWLWNALAPHLTGGLLAKALAIATTQLDEYSRIKAFEALAPYLPADLLEGALEAATAFTTDYGRARALAAIAPYLPGSRRPQVVADAMSLVAADSDSISVVRRVASYLPPDLLGEALSTATIGSTYRHTRLINLLAPHLSGELLATALTAAIADPSEYSRAKAFKEIAPHLTGDLLTVALSAAKAMGSDYERAEALVALTPYLSASDRPPARAEILAAVGLCPEYRRAEILAELAPHMPPSELPRALAVAKAIPSPGSRADALTGLIPHLPAALRSDVLADALAAAKASGDHRPWTLVALLPYLPASEHHETLAHALDGAMPRENSEYPDAGLDKLAPLLTCDLLPKAASMTMNEMTRSALLERAHYLLTDDNRKTVLKLLHDSLTGLSRESCLIVIKAAALIIDKTGGPDSVRECVCAIRDVNRWWP